jgi:hypothetical protein
VRWLYREALVPKISFSPLVVETSQRMYGISALVELIYRATPEVEFREREALKELAEREGWDYGDYSVEDQFLDIKFGYWLPRLSAYSVLILLSSIVETQLASFAKNRADLRKARFDPKDFRNGVLKKAADYIYKVSDPKLDIKGNAHWQPLEGLRFLRNIVAHRAGKPRNDQRRRVELMCKKYSGLSSDENPRSFGGAKELGISVHACRFFAGQAEGFFKGVFSQCNLPHYGGLWPNIEANRHQSADKK